MGLITSCILVLLTSQLALGQGSTSPTPSSPSPTSTSSASAATVTISVGAEGLAFSPAEVTANVGDIVEFWFYPQNHSVARSDFKSPCIPYEDTGVGRQGFWSGFVPIAVILSQPPTFQVLINDTAPIFFYCSAPGACIENGMVGVINPNSTETLDIQKAYAKNATLMFSPGQYFPVEIAPSASSSTFSTSPSSTPTATAVTEAVSTLRPVLSTGEIAAIAVGGSAVLLLAAALLYLCGRQRTMGELIQQNQASHTPSSYLLGPENISVASSSAYPQKAPHMDVDPLGVHRWSTERPMYDRVYERVTPDTESFRSRSPPVDESRGYVVPVMTGSPGTTSPPRACSPLFRRPVSDSPDRQNMSPISPLDETFFQPLGRSFGTEQLEQFTGMQEPLTRESIPPPLRVHRYNSQRGPHELSVESDRAYLPYRNGVW